MLLALVRPAQRLRDLSNAFFYPRHTCFDDYMDYRNLGYRLVLDRRTPCKSSMASLPFDQRAIENRSIVKLCLVGPPDAPSIFIRFLNWQVNE
jgi:hypothetical protein